MNGWARDALVSAALEGIPQVRFRLTDDEGGYCAGGILIRKALQEQGRPYDTNSDLLEFRWPSILAKASMTMMEWSKLVAANNEGWDFLTIARKFSGQDHA